VQSEKTIKNHNYIIKTKALLFLVAKLALPLLEKQSILIQASFVCAATGGNSFEIQVSTARPLFDLVRSTNEST